METEEQLVNNEMEPPLKKIKFLDDSMATEENDIEKSIDPTTSTGNKIIQNLVMKMSDSQEESNILENDSKISNSQLQPASQNHFNITASQAVSKLAETHTHFEWKIDNWNEDIGQVRSSDFVLNGTNQVCFLTILRNIYDTKIIEFDDRFLYNDILIDVAIVSKKDSEEDNIKQPTVDIYFLCDGDRMNGQLHRQHNVINRSKNVLDAVEIPPFNKINSTLVVCCDFKYVVDFCNSNEIMDDRNTQYCKSYATKLILDNYDLLYVNQQLCDITFKIGDAAIKAHSFVLATLSPYFFAMLSKENFKNTGDYIIDLSHDSEVNCQAFQSFLEWAYGCKSVNELGDVVFDLLILANKYDVQKLQSFCESYLLDTMNEDNVCKIILFANMYGCGLLKTKSLAYAKTCIEVIKNSKELEEMCKDSNLIRELL